MRLCHETSKGLELPTGSSQRSVKTDRKGCHPHAMDTQRPSFLGGFDERRFATLGHGREPRNFWGCKQPGAGSLFPQWESPSA
jgi:hypothetical protein